MITVNGHTYIPSELKWLLQDISQADSGRDSTGTMYKNRLKGEGGKKIKLEMEFKGLTWNKASQLMQDFDAEYVSVTYPDVKLGRMETKEFYSGDKEAVFYTWNDTKKVFSVIKFNIIER